MYLLFADTLISAFSAASKACLLTSTLWILQGGNNKRRCTSLNDRRPEFFNLQLRLRCLILQPRRVSVCLIHFLKSLILIVGCNTAARRPTTLRYHTWAWTLDRNARLKVKTAFLISICLMFLSSTTRLIATILKYSNVMSLCLKNQWLPYSYLSPAPKKSCMSSMASNRRLSFANLSPVLTREILTSTHKMCPYEKCTDARSNKRKWWIV